MTTPDPGLGTARDPASYAQQLRQLLPQGAAWSFAPDGVLAGVLLAMGDGMARVDARALDLLEEADPRTALELLSDWERVAALPDACVGEPDNVRERQIALTQKLTRIGSQTIAAYEAMAARVGYVVRIEEHRPARMGMLLGDRLNGAEWAFVWTVHIRQPDGEFEESSFLAQAHLGDRLGVRLRGFGALDIECVIRRAAPAHTVVLFAYDIEPDAAFWFDFTS